MEPGDKKHLATPRHRERARAEGRVSKSPDLASAALLMLALLCLRWLGGPLLEKVAIELSQSLSAGPAMSWTVEDAVNRLSRAAVLMAFLLTPILSLLFIGGIAANVAQTGWLLTPSAVAPNIAHLNPLAGVKRIASLRGLMRLGFGIFKVAVIATVAYFAIRSRGASIVAIGATPLPELAHELFATIFEICLRIAAALLVLGFVEYGFQRWRYEQDLMMTDQELRDEMKESQGDPQSRDRRKQLQRERATPSVSDVLSDADWADADWVLIGSTGRAIALRYRPERQEAPVVVAKGFGPTARRMQRNAVERRIPVVNRDDLTETLYRSVETGDAIPAASYRAVAELFRNLHRPPAAAA